MSIAQLETYGNNENDRFHYLGVENFTLMQGKLSRSKSTIVNSKYYYQINWKRHFVIILDIFFIL